MAPITTADYHTGGEPFRIVTGGAELPRGETILGKRRDALERIQSAAGELQTRLDELEAQEKRTQELQQRLGELRRGGVGEEADHAPVRVDGDVGAATAALPDAEDVEAVVAGAPLGVVNEVVGAGEVHAGRGEHAEIREIVVRSRPADESMTEVFEPGGHEAPFLQATRNSCRPSSLAHGAWQTAGVGMRGGHERLRPV